MRRWEFLSGGLAVFLEYVFDGFECFFAVYFVAVLEF